MVIENLLPGGPAYQQQIYPNPADLDPKTGLKTYEDVIAYFTEISRTAHLQWKSCR